MATERAKGEVVMYSAGPEYVSQHTGARNTDYGRRIALLRGDNFAGQYQESGNYSGDVYFIPHRTLVMSPDAARALGIQNPEDLFGGVVPFGYLATKAVTHGLIGTGAASPDGWSDTFANAVKDVVLPGFTVFSVHDARLATEQLLQGGPARGKRTLSASGRGQTLIETPEDLEATLAMVDPDELTKYGLVIERNLAQVFETYSVGQVTIDGQTISYYGTQRTTPNNDGVTDYGGSDLIIVKGGYDDLLTLDLPDNIRLAIQQGAKYDSATGYYPDMIISRRNYDVGQGVDSEGNFMSGVFEQSWRIGGASGAEITALEAFKADPSLAVVRSSTHHVFGENLQAPTDAIVHFDDVDRDFGPMMVYTTITK